MIEHGSDTESQMLAAAGIYFALAFWLKVPYAKEFLARLPAKFKRLKA